MINNNEQIIRNYIFQIRRPFSLVQVTEDTGVAKSSCQRVLKKYLKEGKIVRTGDGCTPKLYRYVYPKAIKKKKLTTKSTKNTKKVYKEGSREAEVQAKADELGVCTRTVYRMEERGNYTQLRKANKTEYPKFEEYKRKRLAELGISEEEFNYGNDS